MCKNKLNVLVAAPDYPYPVVGGLQKQAHELNQQLLLLHTSIVVLSGKHNNSNPSREVVDGVLVRRAPYLSQRRLRLAFNALWAAWNVFWSVGRYDVVHIHNLSTYGALVSIAAWLRRKPVLMKLPNVGQMGIPGLRKYFFGDGILLMLKSVSAFVAMSEQSVVELGEINTLERKILRMVNGINVEVYDEKSISKKVNTGLKRTKVIFTGRFVTQKGLDELLNAWGALYRDGKLNGALLQLVGDGPELASLKELSKELGLTESVEFMGFRDDVPSLLQQASIFVLPSHVEGNSNSILEAMAAGLPIVATDVGGTRMQVGDIAADWIIPAHDVEGLRRCLARMLGSEELRLRMGALMRKRIEEHFDIRVVAEGYHAAYEALASDLKADMRPFISPAFNQ